MTPGDIDAIRRRAAAAEDAPPVCADGHCVTFRADHATADFFAAAKRDVTRLVAEVDGLRHALRRCREINAGASAGLDCIIDAALGDHD